MTIEITTSIHNWPQRDLSTDTATDTVEGTYTGAGAIERSIDGGEFVTVIASPSGGTFTDTYTISAGRHTVVYRMANDTADNVTTTRKCGDWWVLGPAQSNMSGDGNVLDASIYDSGNNNLDVSLFGNNDEFEEFKPRFNSNTGQVDAISSDPDGWSWVPFFASYYALDNNPIPLGLIPCSKNGTNTSRWLKTDSTRVSGLNLYDSALRRAQEVGGIRGCFWQTAEGDASLGTLAATYKSNALQFESDFVADLGYAIQIFIVPYHNVIGRDGNGTTTGSVPIRNAQIELAAENSTWFIAQETVTGIDISVGGTDDAFGENDGVHLRTYQARHEFGRRIAESYRAIFGNTEPALSLSSFTYGQEITGQTITGTESNQVLTITDANLHADFWANVSRHGGDVRAYEDDACTNRIPLYLRKFDYENQKIVFDVAKPSYSSASRNVFIFCGNDDLVQPAFTETYGRNAVYANEEAVLLLDSKLFADSSGNNYFGLPIFGDGLATTTHAHPLGLDWTVFPLDVRALKLKDSPSILSKAANSISALVRVSNNANSRGILATRGGAASNYHMLTVRSAVTPYYGYMHDGTTGSGEGFGSDRTLGVVDRVSLNVKDNTVECRVNGADGSVLTGLTDGIELAQASLTIGTFGGYSLNEAFSGYIGEVKVNKGHKTGESERLEHNSSTDTANFWTQSAPFTPTNSTPNANAGPDQSNIAAEANVQLDATGSSDSDGTIASYAWNQTAGTSVTLSNATIASPTFTAPTTGSNQTLTFELTITDDEGATHTDTVNIEILAEVVANNAPNANAGTDQSNITAGSNVQLDATGSSDSDGTIVSYAWNQTAGDSVTLSDTTIANPTFTAPITNSDQTLTFNVVITDDDGATDSDTVNVGVLAEVLASASFVANLLLPAASGLTGFAYSSLKAGTTQHVGSGIVSFDSGGNASISIESNDLTDADNIIVYGSDYDGTNSETALCFAAEATVEAV